MAAYGVYARPGVGQERQGRTWPTRAPARVTARALTPAHDVGVVAVTASQAIGAQGEDVVAGGVLLTGKAIEVGMIPGVHRDLLAEVGAAPTARLTRVRACRSLPEGAQAFGRIGVVAVVEAIGVEGGAEHLDLAFGRGVLRSADVA